jgi:SpoVK/Ycf46/Vps4 family AAA+-type ATPase
MLSANAFGCPRLGVFVMGTTARIGDLDSAIRRTGRIDKEIEISVPSSADREEILLSLLHRAGVSVDVDGVSHGAVNGETIPSAEARAGSALSGMAGLRESVVRQVAQQAHGMVGADLLSVVKEAFYLTLRQRETMLDNAVSAATDSPIVLSASSVAATYAVGTKDTIDISVGNLADEFADLDVEDEHPESIAGTDRSLAESTEPVGSARNVSASGGSADDVAIAEGKVADRAATGTVATATDTKPAPGLVHPSNGEALITEAALQQAVRRISPSALREVVIEVPSVRWGDIGGMEGVKQSLREVCAMCAGTVQNACHIICVHVPVLIWFIKEASTTVVCLYFLYCVIASSADNLNCILSLLQPTLYRYNS